LGKEAEVEPEAEAEVQAEQLRGEQLQALVHRAEPPGRRRAAGVQARRERSALGASEGFPEQGPARQFHRLRQAVFQELWVLIRHPEPPGWPIGLAALAEPAHPPQT
jgi:hypothetical protein